MKSPIQRQLEIFSAALEHPAGPKRDEFLAQACGGDETLRRYVQGLLAGHDKAGTFLDQAAGPVGPGGTHLVPITEKPGDRIGRYKLLQQIGEGGCGVVYMAEQEEPVRRRVALKVIRLGMDTKSVVARFEAERQALALMDHPNIARVFDGGATESGRPYFVMELVRGIKITDYCDQAHLSTEQRLELFIQVCQALQHAHQKGVIHRDIKPSNILVTVNDGVAVPKVIDFGIAKATDQRLTDKSYFTEFHVFIGTPAYTSPEQAEMSSLDVDTRSDIYSLGVLLYEMLTGQTPIPAERLVQSGLDEMRRIIREEEPPRPSTRLTSLGLLEATDLSQKRQVKIPALASTIRGDLDWIVMKALEKDRTRRYSTSLELAADIERHLHNEPVLAAAPSGFYKLQKLVRRNKVAFAAAGAVALAMLIGLVMAQWQAVRARNAERAARAAQYAEKTQAAQARTDRDRAVRAESDARVQAEAAKEGWSAARRNSYAAEINVALQALAENNLGRARDLLDRQRPNAGEEDLRGFEWRYLWQLCQGDELETFHDDGAHGAAFSPDGKLFAYSGGKIFVRDTGSRKLVAKLGRSATTLSFSPSAKLLASAHDSGVTLWDTEMWQEVRALPDTTQGCRFSPDGRWLVTGTPEGWRLWNTQTWEPAGDCPGTSPSRWHGRNAVAFSPDSQFLVTGASEVFQIVDHLRVWRLPGLEELPAIRFGGFGGGIPPISVAFSADGKQLIVGYWTGEIVVWDFATRKVVATLREHTGSVTAIALAADGKMFATTSTDRTVNVWDAATYKLLVRLRGHVGEVWAGAISPDGSMVVSCSADDATKLWSTGTRHTNTVLNGAGLMLGFLGGGRHLVGVSTNSVCMWTLENGARVDFPVPPNLRTIKGLSGKSYDLKPTEQLYAVGRSDGSIELWPLTAGAKATSWPAHDEAVGAVAFSADGKRLATSSANGEVKIWDSATRREAVRIEPVGRHLICLAFSADGKMLAGSGMSSRVWLWDVASGRELLELGGHGQAVLSVAFSPDGKLLATTTLITDEAHLWELPSGRQIATLKGHVQGVIAVEFSPDGKTLATASHDSKVKLWNVATHQELVAFPFAGHVTSARFSPDGRALAIDYFDESGFHVQLVRAPSFEEIAAVEGGRAETAIWTP
ncbi:MAG TPA: serine/threonine-protein kinase [Verrucomicrobiae bacterium]|nr:serine/threonine-protein kinase [Verrucomicrobiae bacterium]